jgi:wyosine [tRNA(Phe)-imidazoG37] synthetase (radical SAM superfamily)
VREALEEADWISLKMDSVTEASWRRINLPHRQLALPSILDGARTLAGRFTGRLVTETMLVAGLNDGAEELTALAWFLERLQPSKAYLAVPTRPPAERRVRMPEEKILIEAYQILASYLPAVEFLIGYEKGEFVSLGDPEEALLAILAVHPLTEEALTAFLVRVKLGKVWLDSLIRRGVLVRVAYRDKTFYVRRFRESDR